MAQIAVELAAEVCPKAPPGVENYSNDILSWVKWMTLAIMGMTFFASIGMLVWGRVTHHPKGARFGLDGIMAILLAAILYVVGYPVIKSITGTGC